MKRCVLAALFVLASCGSVFAQLAGTGGIGYGSSLPSTCSKGDVFAVTGTPTLSVCTALNTWTNLAIGVLAKATSLNLNQTNTDNAVTVAGAKYVVRKVVVTNCSTSLAISAATIGVFTSTGGGGTTVVALGLLTALTAATKYIDMTLALTTDTLSAATLYVRNGVTHGGAATCDVYILGDVLP